MKSRVCSEGSIYLLAGRQALSRKWNSMERQKLFKEHPLLQSLLNFTYFMAWFAVMATMLTISLTEQPLERSLIGAAIPCNTGPIASAPAKR